MMGWLLYLVPSSARPVFGPILAVSVPAQPRRLMDDNSEAGPPSASRTASNAALGSGSAPQMTRLRIHLLLFRARR